MDPTGCDQYSFTDKVVDDGEFCASSRTGATVLVSLLLISHCVVACAATLRWRRKNFGSSRSRQAGRPRHEYCLGTRLPILPTLISAVAGSSIIFWSLTLNNSIGIRSNGGTVVLFAIHIFLAFVAMHLHLLKFVRLEKRLQPIASKGADPSRSSENREIAFDDRNNGSRALFMLAALASLAGCGFGVIGGGVEPDRSWIVSACGICYALAALALMLCFIVQLNKTIDAVHAIKTLSITKTRHGELDKTVQVLRRHRTFAAVTLGSMTIVSIVLAVTEHRPWFLLLIADTILVGHTVMIWIDEVIFVRTRARNRTLSPSLPSPLPAGVRKRLPGGVSKLASQPRMQAEVVIAINRSTPSPKSKISPNIHEKEVNFRLSDGHSRLRTDNPEKISLDELGRKE